ncbi:hypothetical protein Tco_0379135, partial [Tanacetum coccineum]
YYPPSKTVKQLEEIRNFKQEDDETLYQAWDRYNDLLYKFPTHDINSHQKVNIFYNGLGTMNCQFLDSQGPIPGITPAQALTTIQTMADHSQKWHNGSSSRNVNNSSNSEGIAAILTMEILVDHFQTTAEITIDLMEECLDNHRQEEDEVRMNPKYLALLQNQLPHKEKDPGSFILPCSIKRLDFNNALADLGASISVMPFSMYKRLGIGKLEPINMDFKMPIILGRPLLATSHAKVDIFKKSISLEVGNEKVIFKMRNSFTTTTIESIHAIRSEIRMKDDETKKETNMGKQLDLASVRKQKDYWRQEFNEDQDDIDPTVKVEDGEDPEEYETDLEGIIDYLEPKSYDGFIDLDDKAYKERKCKLLGIIYRKPPPILIEKVKVTRYIVGPPETYTKVKFLGIDEMPRTKDNIATIRVGLMEEMGADGSAQGEM